MTHNETHALYLIEIFSSGGCIAILSRLYPKAVLLFYRAAQHQLFNASAILLTDAGILIGAYMQQILSCFDEELEDQRTTCNNFLTLMRNDQYSI